MIEFTPLASSSAANAYRVSCEGFAPILLDCGLPWTQLQAALKFKTSELAGCIVSHRHKDHCNALPTLTMQAIDVYASADVWEAWKGVRTPIAPHYCHVINAGEEFSAGDWDILPFLVPHDVETCGFYIAAPDGESKLLYLTDSGYVPNTFSGLTHLCIECNHSRELMRESAVAGRHAAHNRRAMASHLSLESLEKFLDAQDLTHLKECWLLHCSANNSDEAEFIARIQRKTGVVVRMAAK